MYERNGRMRNVFLQDARRLLLSQTVPSLSAISYRPSLLVLYLRARRTASPFYPLSFILYPLYPGLPRQADASAPNGIMRRELVLYQLSRAREHRACLIFPIGPANCATHGSPRPLHRAPSPVPHGPRPPTPRVHQCRFLPLFLSLRDVLRAR